MRRDAKIAGRVIDGFLMANKPIIPIHDSFVVQASEIDRLMEEMYLGLRMVLRPHAVRLTSSSLPKVKVKTAASEYITALPRGVRPRLNTQWQTGPGEELNSRMSL